MKRLSDDTVRVTVRLPRALVEEISRGRANRSAAIRECIERCLAVPTDVWPALPEKPGKGRRISTPVEAREAVGDLSKRSPKVQHHPACKCAVCQARRER